MILIIFFIAKIFIEIRCKCSDGLLSVIVNTRFILLCVNSLFEFSLKYTTWNIRGGLTSLTTSWCHTVNVLCSEAEYTYTFLYLELCAHFHTRWECSKICKSPKHWLHLVPFLSTKLGLWGANEAYYVRSKFCNFSVFHFHYMIVWLVIYYN